MKYAVPSKSEPGSDHVVTNVLGQWTCDCAGFKFHSACRHTDQLKTRMKNVDKLTLNETQIRIKGRINTPFSLEQEELVKVMITSKNGGVTVEGQVTEQLTKTNHDGTCDLVNVIQVSYGHD